MPEKEEKQNEPEEEIKNARKEVYKLTLEKWISQNELMDKKTINLIFKHHRTEVQGSCPNCGQITLQAADQSGKGDLAPWKQNCNLCKHRKRLHSVSLACADKLIQHLIYILGLEDTITAKGLGNWRQKVVKMNQVDTFMREAVKKLQERAMHFG